jgi:hypothetical protein
MHRKNLYLMHDSHSPFRRKMCSPASLVPPLSHLISCTPTKSSVYFDTSFAIVTSDFDLHRLLTCQVPNPIPIFFSLGSLPKGSAKVRGSFKKFRNKLILLRCEVVSTTPNPQAIGPPLAGCPRLLVQCILSYLPP